MEVNPQMNDLQKIQTRTREVVVEICPDCNALHIHGVTGGLLDGLGKKDVPCGVQIGWEPPPEGADDKELKPILCKHIITPVAENIFVIRHFTLKERREHKAIYDAVFKANKDDVASNSELMDYVLLHGVVKAPFATNVKEDLENAPVNGMILEAVYYAVLEFNAVPLAPSNGLRLQSTRTPQNSATKTQ
jgi:hypothetical protein